MGPTSQSGVRPRSEPQHRRWAGWVVEAGAGVLVVAVVGWTALGGWRLYESAVLPHAVLLPAPAPTPTFDADAARRQQQVLDHLGAGFAFAGANRHDLAEQQIRAALALDPEHTDARRALRELLESRPTATALKAAPAPRR